MSDGPVGNRLLPDSFAKTKAAPEITRAFGSLRHSRRGRKPALQEGQPLRRPSHTQEKPI